MPDKLAPSEFGGKVQRNRVQPFVRPDGVIGHSPTPSERLMLTYTTGSEDGLNYRAEYAPDDGSAFEGLLPLPEAIEAAPKPEPFEF